MDALILAISSARQCLLMHPTTLFLKMQRDASVRYIGSLCCVRLAAALRSGYSICSTVKRRLNVRITHCRHSTGSGSMHQRITISSCLCASQRDAYLAWTAGPEPPAYPLAAAWTAHRRRRPRATHGCRRWPAPAAGRQAMHARPPAAPGRLSGSRPALPHQVHRKGCRGCGVEEVSGVKEQTVPEPSGIKRASQAPTTSQAPAYCIAGQVAWWQACITCPCNQRNASVQRHDAQVAGGIV